jgi:hypothetical protein
MFFKVAEKLENLEPYEVVKVASLLNNLLGWINNIWSSPSYQKEVTELRGTSTNLKGDLKVLVEEIERLQFAIDNTDTVLYTESLLKIQALLKNLSSVVDDFKDATTDALEIQEYIKYVQPGFKKNKEVFEKLRKQLPEELDVPIERKINKPLKSFSWFANLATNNIVIRADSEEKIINTILEIVYKETGATDDVAIRQLLDKNKIEIVRRLKNSILNGNLLEYRMADVRKGAKHQVANQMIALVAAKPVKIPETNIEISFPTNVLLDNRPSAAPDENLVLLRSDNIRLHQRLQNISVASFSEDVANSLVKNAYNKTSLLCIAGLYDKEKFVDSLITSLRIGLDVNSYVYKHDNELIVESGCPISTMIAVGQIIKEAKSFKVSFFEIDEMPEVTALSLKEFTSADRKYLLESL